MVCLLCLVDKGAFLWVSQDICYVGQLGCVGPGNGIEYWLQIGVCAKDIGWLLLGFASEVRGR